MSARDLPTRCQQQCSLVVPTVRASGYLTEPSAKSRNKQPTKRPEREGRRGQPAPRSAFPARCSDRRQRPMTRTPPCHRSRRRPPLAWPTDFGASIAGVSRMVAASATVWIGILVAQSGPSQCIAQEETCSILSPSQDARVPRWCSRRPGRRPYLGCRRAIPAVLSRYAPCASNESDRHRS
jgi:hypothetical protein